MLELLKKLFKGMFGNYGTTLAPKNVNISKGRTEVVDLANKICDEKIPYLYGGTTLKGFDCSGFVLYVLKSVFPNANIPRIAAGQESLGDYVKLSEAVPGDLVFWSSSGKHNAYHVGIYIGSNQYIDSGTTGQVVSKKNITENFDPSYFVSPKLYID